MRDLRQQLAIAHLLRLGLHETAERCANYKGTVARRKPTQPASKRTRKKPAEACPAPITQIKPAQPGTVSPLNPEGQKLAQRPRPAGLEEAAAPEGEIPGGIPGGAVPGATGE